MLLYLIVDAAACGERGVVETARQAAAAGVDLIQYRAPGATDQEYLATALEIEAAIDDSNAGLILSERPHLLGATNALGVHVGEEYRKIAEARAIIGEEAMLGVSGFLPSELIELVGANFELDYLSVGPVWATVSKADAGSPIGVAEATARVEQSPWPAMLFGGITAGNLAELEQTNAAGVVVLGEVCRAQNVAAAVRALGELAENY